MNEKTIIDELIDIFRVFDRDEDGYIDRSELLELMQCEESSTMKEFIHGMLAEADREGEGSIELKPFLYAMLTDRKK